MVGIFPLRIKLWDEKLSEYFYCYRKDLRKPCSDGMYIWTGSLPPLYHQRWLEGQCHSLLTALSSSLLSLQSYNKQHKRSQRNAPVQSYQHNIWTEEIPAIIVSAHGLTEKTLSLSAELIRHCHCVIVRKVISTADEMCRCQEIPICVERLSLLLGARKVSISFTHTLTPTIRCTYAQSVLFVIYYV